MNYSFINCKISLQLRRRGSRHKCAPERGNEVYVDEWPRHVTIFNTEGVLATSYWEIYVFHKTQGFWEIFDRFYLQIKPDGFVDHKSVFSLNLNNTFLVSPIVYFPENKFGFFGMIFHVVVYLSKSFDCVYIVCNIVSFDMNDKSFGIFINKRKSIAWWTMSCVVAPSK